MYEHFNAIENVAVGVMGIESLIACHLRVSVVVLHHVVVDDDAERASHNLVVGNDYHLPFREDGNKLFYLLVSPKHVVVGVYAMKRTRKLVIV